MWRENPLPLIPLRELAWKGESSYFEAQFQFWYLSSHFFLHLAILKTTLGKEGREETAQMTEPKAARDQKSYTLTHMKKNIEGKFTPKKS